VNPRTRRIVIYAVVAIVTLALDQSSKVWARGALVPGVPQPLVAGYWDWELAYNPGIAFSMFVGATAMRVILSLVATGAVVAITVAAARAPELVRRVALALIAGGAAGNLVDRVRDGAVTDFVRWHVHEHMWPIFNVADATLLIGVLLLVTEGFFARRRERAKIAT
jgi:signal peptidase II